MVKEGFRVGPPIELKAWWDLDRTLFQLVLHLSSHGRIGMIWLGPPCTTFSLARCPRLRSLASPWGFDALDLDTAECNLHMHQALALFLSQKTSGEEAVLETPWGASSRKLPWWRRCTALGREIRVDQCRYGVPYMKPTALLCTSSAFGGMGRRCQCLSQHVRLEGSLTSAAAQYPPTFCEAFASIARAVVKSSQERTDHHLCATQAIDEMCEDLRDHRGAQRFVSHMWSTHLAESLPWKVRRAYRFKHPNHINVLESHAHKTFYP